MANFHIPKMGVNTLISSASKAITGTSGSVTPRNENVISRKVLFPQRSKVALGDRKKGFVTPLNKNVISRKVLFPERAEVALGDIKNNFRFGQTPSKSDTGEKTKQPDLFFSTPISKSKNLAQMANPEWSNIRKPMSTACGGKKLEESWEDKLKTDEDTFNLLFLNGPTVGLRPLTPEPESYYEEPVAAPYSDFDFCWDFSPTIGHEIELPIINRSLTDDIF